MKTWIIVGIMMIIVGGGVTWWASQQRPAPDQPSNQTRNVAATNTAVTNTNTELTAADKAGKDLSAGRCTGTDKPKLTHLPMRLEDFSMILPYGPMVGGHVTLE